MTDPTTSAQDGTSELNAVYYGREQSRDWDRDLGERSSTAPAVNRLYELSAGRSVLEFGIGTGRLALPLRARGLRVAGIEYSSWMAAELAAKPLGDEIPVVIGDFTSARFEERFGLVYLASFTLFALSTVEEQLACFANAARHLQKDGLFVVELPSTGSGIYVNGRAPMSSGHGWYERGGTGRNVWLLLRQVDRTARTTRQCYVDLRDGQLPGLRPSDGRYASPDEVDLMARAAGLEPVGRWSGWSGIPFRPEVLTYHAAYRRGARSSTGATAAGTGISSGTSRSG
jgi:SAM-dependent methyltransferase